MNTLLLKILVLAISIAINISCLTEPTPTAPECPPITRRIAGQASFDGILMPLANQLAECLQVKATLFNLKPD